MKNKNSSTLKKLVTIGLPSTGCAVIFVLSVISATIPNAANAQTATAAATATTPSTTTAGSQASQRNASSKNARARNSNAEVKSDIPFRSNFQSSPEALTTERIWALDPNEKNPHRQRWILKRDVDLKGLAAVKLGVESYGVSAVELLADTTAYTRPDGAAFSHLDDFPCSNLNSKAGAKQGSADAEESPSSRQTAEATKDTSWFETIEGAQYAEQIASKNWEELLDREKIKLEVKLRNVRGEFPETAIKNAHDLFIHWLGDVDAEWRSNGRQKVRDAEWKHYKELVSSSDVCKKTHKIITRDDPHYWKEFMEPITGPKTPDLSTLAAEGKILALAPAKRWGGLFSIRATIKVGEHTLVGQFLVDSGAPSSLISPDFLQGQGVYPAWIEVPQSVPQKIFWSGGTGVAKPANIAELKISGLTVPIHEFMIHETDFFGPPDSFATCCDGVLGADFLRLYAVEIRPGTPNEIRLFPRDGFSLAKDAPWVEASTNARGEIVSDGCFASPMGQETSRSQTELQGVKWDTGDESALAVFPALASHLESVSKHWNLFCDGAQLAHSVSVTSQETLGVTQKSPAINVGMEVLGRGPFTFDISHGRIWFSQKAIESPIVQNRSGVTMDFTYQDGNRILRITSLGKTPETEKLTKAGLRVGSRIMLVDSKPVDEMDQWEVDQRLSGIYGDTVALQWSLGKKNDKSVAFSVKQPTL